MVLRADVSREGQSHKKTLKGRCTQWEPWITRNNCDVESVSMGIHRLSKLLAWQDTCCHGSNMARGCVFSKQVHVAHRAKNIPSIQNHRTARFPIYSLSHRLPPVLVSLTRTSRDKTTIMYCSTFYVHFDGSWPKLKSLTYTVSDKYEICRG
jgi:hypothetical protein